MSDKWLRKTSIGEQRFKSCPFIFGINLPKRGGMEAKIVIPAKEGGPTPSKLNFVQTCAIAQVRKVAE
jgi:hypothetical protein